MLVSRIALATTVIHDLGLLEVHIVLVRPTKGDNVGSGSARASPILQELGRTQLESVHVLHRLVDRARVRNLEVLTIVFVAIFPSSEHVVIITDRPFNSATFSSHPATQNIKLVVPLARQNSRLAHDVIAVVARVSLADLRPHRCLVPLAEADLGDVHALDWELALERRDGVFIAQQRETLLVELLFVQLLDHVVLALADLWHL